MVGLSAAQFHRDIVLSHDVIVDSGMFDNV
jgi:hypothetical protein